jgi:hypothetical protein
LLAGRPVWKLEPQSSPGAPPLWCFGAGIDPDLAVETSDRSVTVSLLELDQELVFADTDALVAWLDSNEPLFLQRGALGPDAFGRLLAGRLAEWRGQGH